MEGEMQSLRIGTSGWTYNHWLGVFYPEDLPKSRWLEHYCRHFDTVEINCSFYRLPREATFSNWRKRAPEGFIFAVKASRYITHVKRLSEIEESLELFLSRAELLGEKLGPILFQLPPRFKADPERLERLLSLLPEGLKAAFEFRDESWFCREIYELLERHNAALCIADSPKFPRAFEVTADFSYFRLHGSKKLYASRYTREELEGWASIIREHLRSGLDVYVYFDNDAFGYAVENALELKGMLEG